MRDTLDSPLPSRYERFISEYLIDQNASAAARRAGYSVRSCARQGTRLLRRPEIRARLRGELQGLMAQSRASARDLMEQRCKVAHFRTSGMFDAEGRFLDFKQMDAQTFDCLRISVRLRKGEPEYFIRPPNQEAALRALERLNEKLDRQDALQFEREEQARREAEKAEPGRRSKAGPRRRRKAVPVLDLEKIDGPVLKEEIAQAAEDAAPAVAVPAQAAAPQACSSTSAAPEMSGEKTRKHGHSWTFGKAKAALSGALGTAKELLVAGKVDKRKGPRTPEELKDPSYSFRDDPDWMNGGRVSRKVEEVFQQPAGEPFVERIGEVVCRRRVTPGMPAGHWEGRRPYLRGQRQAYAESNRDDPFAEY